MSESEVDYSNTIIYKITCKNPEITDKYVGHTIDFAKRKYAHRNSTNNEKSPCYNLKLYKFIRDNGGWDNWKMDIVNFYNCSNLREAKAKEQEHYIELHATLNSIEPLKFKENVIKICKDVSPVNKSKRHINRKDFDLTHSTQINAPDANKHNIEPIKSKKFICEKCDIGTDNKKDFGKHLITIKHKNNCDTSNIQSTIIENSYKLFPCNNCNMSYKSRVGLWYHKKKCTKSQLKPDVPCDYTSLISQIIKQNNELKNSILEQRNENKKALLEVLNN
jgi:hypothetical protein